LKFKRDENVSFHLIYKPIKNHTHLPNFSYFYQGALCLWSYGSWIYNYLCNQCLSPLMLWVQILLRRGVHGTAWCDKDCQWLVTGRWFSPGTLVSSTNKTDHHDIAEILLKVVLTTITIRLSLHVQNKYCEFNFICCILIFMISIQSNYKI
jgi:hypothetical protein